MSSKKCRSSIQDGFLFTFDLIIFLVTLRSVTCEYIDYIKN